MNLFYEVADSQGRPPYKTAGQWFSVPKEDGWQTHTWRVSDACFSRMWGYDAGTAPLAPQLAPEAPNPGADPGLARVVAAWPDLPAHVKAAVLALVGTAFPT
jgi:hypothetical protein